MTQCAAPTASACPVKSCMVLVQVLREGRPVALRVPLDRPHALVPLHLGGAQPSYLVVAGGVPLLAGLIQG